MIAIVGKKNFIAGCKYAIFTKRSFITTLLIYSQAYLSMNRSNDFLAKGLGFLVRKIFNKKSLARNCSPSFLASTLKDFVKATRGSYVVGSLIFLLCRVTRYFTEYVLFAFKGLLMEYDISFLFDFRSIRILMETVMGSNFVSFCRKNSSTDLTQKKVYELVLSKGSTNFDKIDIESFETSVLKILNAENTCVPTTVHHESGLLISNIVLSSNNVKVILFIYSYRICTFC